MAKRERNSKYQKFVISDMYDLQNQVMEMTDAKECKVFVPDTKTIDEFAEFREFSQNEKNYESEFKAIVNSKTNKVAQIATSSYEILQHRDFFSLLASSLEEIGVRDIYGFLLERNQGDAYTLRVNFKDHSITEPKVGDNIALGIEFENSFNKFYAANGAAWLLRLSCTNGMTMDNSISGANFYRNHNAKSQEALLSSVTNMVTGFVKKILDSGDTITHIIEKAMQDEIIFKDPRQLYDSLESMFGTKKHAEAIGDIARKDAIKAGDNLILDRWSLYNAVTYHTSHDAMTPDTFSQILQKAERKILNTNYEIPLPIPMPTVV